MAVVPLLGASWIWVLDLDEREVLIVPNATVILGFMSGHSGAAADDLEESLVVTSSGK